MARAIPWACSSSIVFNVLDVDHQIKLNFSRPTPSKLCPTLLIWVRPWRAGVESGLRKERACACRFLAWCRAALFRCLRQ